MFTFKSTGVKIDNVKYNKKVNSVDDVITTPINIKTPLEQGINRTELYKMNIDPVIAIADNLRNLLQTDKGQRLGRYNIGCDLSSILFDRTASNSGEYERVAIENINEQIDRFIPAINIDNIEFSPIQNLDTSDRSSLSRVIVKVVFSIPQLKRNNNSIEVILYNGG